MHCIKFGRKVDCGYPQYREEQCARKTVFFLSLFQQAVNLRIITLLRVLSYCANFFISLTTFKKFWIAWSECVTSSLKSSCTLSSVNFRPLKFLWERRQKPCMVLSVSWSLCRALSYTLNRYSKAAAMPSLMVQTSQIIGIANMVNALDRHMTSSSRLC